MSWLMTPGRKNAAYVLQAYVAPGHDVYVYMMDGSVHLFHARPFIERVVRRLPQFRPLLDEEIFKRSTMVMYGAVSWDLSDTFDTCHCLDIDPCDMMDDELVDDPLAT